MGLKFINRINLWTLEIDLNSVFASRISDDRKIAATQLRISLIKTFSISTTTPNTRRRKSAWRINCQKFWFQLFRFASHILVNFHAWRVRRLKRVSKDCFCQVLSEKLPRNGVRWHLRNYTASWKGEENLMWKIFHWKASEKLLKRGSSFSAAHCILIAAAWEPLTYAPAPYAPR